MHLRTALRPSTLRDATLRAVGTVLLGLILVGHSVVARPTDCPRRSLLEGGDMVPGFCADYGDPLGWPLLVLGLLLLALGVALLARAAGATRHPISLRWALALATAGAAGLYVAWAYGLRTVCTSIEGTTLGCAEAEAGWRAALLVGSGAAWGVATTLGGAVLLDRA